MKGCYTAIITPFKDGQIDFDSLKKLLRHQVVGGVDGVVPCGTTGESPTLSHEEHRLVIKFTIDEIKKLNQELQKSVKVLAGSGSNSTEESLGLSCDAEKYGADGLLIVTPYYNKPTQQGILEHFLAIARAVEIELIVYNIPGRTGVLIQSETIAEMSRQAPNINTVKDATGDIDQVGKVLHLNPDLDILSGNDSMNLPIYSVGGKGCISVLSNLFPKEVKEIHSLYQTGRTDEALKLHNKFWELMDVLFQETNPIPVKMAAKLMNLVESDFLRLPLTTASPSVADKLKMALDRLSL